MTLITERSVQLSVLNNRIDGGHTQDLLDYIDTNPTAGELITILSNITPYLSDKVLLKTIQYLDTIDHDILTDIVINNSPVTLQILSSLTKLKLEAEYRDKILESQTGISRRFLLEDSLMNEKTELDLATSELLRILLLDTAYVKVDELLEFVESMSANGITLSNEYKILYAEVLMLYIGEDTAKVILDSIVSDDVEIMNSVAYLLMLCDTNVVGHSIINLNSSQLQSLQEIIASDTRVSVNASVFLEIATDTTFEEIIYDVVMPDSMTIAGYCYTNPNCSNLNSGGDTLFIKSSEGMIYENITPAVTDENGHFSFNPFELQMIPDSVEFTISSRVSFSADAAGVRTRSEWQDLSPITIDYRGLQQVWEYKSDSSQDILTVPRSIVVADNIYVAGSIYNSLNNSFDISVQKLDSSGNKLWATTYDNNGDESVADIAVDDSLKTYVLLNSSELSHLIVLDSSGTLQWEMGLEFVFGQWIQNDRSGYINIIGNKKSTNNSTTTINRVSATGNIEWGAELEGEMGCSAAAFDLDTNIVVIRIDSLSNESRISVINRDNGELISDIVLAEVYLNNLIVDNQNNYLMAGNYYMGDRVIVMKYNNYNNSTEWYNEIESEIISITPDCMTRDTAGNVTVLCYDNLGFSITSFDFEGHDNWNITENGNWFAIIKKLALKTDINGDHYILLASNEENNVKFLSYLYKFHFKGEKLWEQSVENTHLFDYTISENANIYCNGKNGTGEYGFESFSSKYAQCNATASLKSTSDNKTEEKVTETNVKLFPNPNDGSMQLVYILADIQPAEFEIYDYTGRKVYSIQLTQSTGRTDISATYLSRGVYMYRLVSEDVSIETGKVVVIK